MKPKQPTIKDVAERAGCGIATVSRVLNETGSASPDTRERVMAAAAALGFEFSALGRSLQSKSTKTLGCVVPSLANPIFADVVQAAQRAANAKGYQLILACSEYDEDLELKAVRTLVAKQVDGLILTVNNAQASEALTLVSRKNLPTALVYNRPVHGLKSWAVDNGEAARAVAKAFAGHGHRHTGFLALRFHRSDRSRERYDGYVAACLSLGLEPPVLLEIEEQDGQLLDLLGGLLDRNKALTGIFASNDYLALAAIKAARQLGRRIPQDLSIVGFDGISSGQMVDPNLATIVTDPAAMGLGAAGYVLALLENEAVPRPLDAKRAFCFRTGGTLGASSTGKADDREAATSLSSFLQPPRTS
ncbi:LacI family DNA-binding transcriptional regulator [Roseibium sp.]|uniref:LacI family DNA-binding transcriptional regulator n=1 Tax=Roseibium sp. TaxID=1936156 RepID=UPI003B503F0C